MPSASLTADRGAWPAAPHPVPIIGSGGLFKVDDIVVTTDDEIVADQAE